MMESVYELLLRVGYTHPLHPTLVHLPIGMVMGALVFALVSLLSDRSRFAVTARHCIVLALVAVFPAVLLGYMDWQHFYGGNWLAPIKMKVILAMVLVMLLSVTVLLQIKTSLVSRENKRFIFLYTACFAVVVGLGYFGGELVFGSARTGTPAGPGEVARQAAGEESVPAYGDVADILDRRCIMCHKGPEPPAGLRLDTYSHLMAGAASGPVVIPGKPDESELMVRIQGRKQPRMPLGMVPLDDGEIRLIERWIAGGAREG